jgi:hypothetical protein
MLAPCDLALPAVFMYVRILLCQWGVNIYCLVIWYGVVGVREYAICIMFVILLTGDVNLVFGLFLCFT